MLIFFFQILQITILANSDIQLLNVSSICSDIGNSHVHVEFLARRIFFSFRVLGLFSFHFKGLISCNVLFFPFYLYCYEE